MKSIHFVLADDNIVKVGEQYFIESIYNGKVISTSRPMDQERAEEVYKYSQQHKGSIYTGMEVEA